MNDEEKKVKEAVEAEAAAKAAAEAEAALSSSIEDIDYKALAESNEALAEARRVALEAAEALIVKNKNINKRQENKEGDNSSITEEKVTEIVKNILASSRSEEDSSEAKVLKEANEKLVVQIAKTAEVARALKAKDGVSKDSTTTHFDGDKTGGEPKLAENSPLKEYKYIGNGVYSLKLKSGKTFFKNTKAAPGQPKTWVE